MCKNLQKFKRISMPASHQGGGCLARRAEDITMGNGNFRKGVLRDCQLCHGKKKNLPHLLKTIANPDDIPAGTTGIHISSTARTLPHPIHGAVIHSSLASHRSPCAFTSFSKLDLNQSFLPSGLDRRRELLQLAKRP